MEVWGLLGSTCAGPRKERERHEGPAKDPQKQAQRIDRAVFLGPLQVASSADDLRVLGVDRCVSLLADDRQFETVALAPAHKTCFCVEDSVDAEDSMRRQLPQAVDKVVALVGEGHKVLVHCSSGISRSSTVVMAYLMKARGCRLMEAYANVRQQRPCVNPNDGFFRALQEYESTVCGVAKTPEERSNDTRLYNAHQLASQLQWAGVTLEEAKQQLDRVGGDAQLAGSALLEQHGS